VLELKISVLLPVYNGANYIEACINSILSQSFSDFELLIIDDCSTDGTLEIINNFNDSRIRVIRKQNRSGYVDSLNLALGMAKGKYIARIDADDICLPGRFQKQIDFLESNPDVGLLGGQIILVPDNKLFTYPTDDFQIKTELLWKNVFAHSAVMFRKDIIEKNNLSYDNSKMPSEDYQLWVQFSKYSKVANLPNPIIEYRIHDNQISSERSKEQHQHYLSIKTDYRAYVLSKIDNSVNNGIFLNLTDDYNFLNELTSRNLRCIQFKDTLLKYSIKKINGLFVNNGINVLQYLKLMLKVRWQLFL